MKTIVLLLAFLAAGYGLLSYHFILLDDSMEILKKSHVRYENTFVDARGVKKLEILTKPDLIEAGINDVLRQVNESLPQEN
ncbi:MAG: hypothetical protein V2I36_06075 [Desulfopila sp.]|jgi:hypothetical protein|nr:hypothetical protein [Desulfopila sp.]